MTVRAWITISAIVVVALAAATAFQFLRPISPPAIAVTADGERLDGAFVGACWPQRAGVLRCTKGDKKPQPQTIPDDGTLRVVLLSPAQPKSGSITVTDSDGDEVLDEGWEREIDYEFDPGSYTLTALAGESDKAYVRYVFRFNVTRSGS